VDTTKFAAAHGDAARRVLALKLATVREAEAVDRFFAVPVGGALNPPAPRAAVPQDAAPPPPAPEAAPVPAKVVEKPKAEFDAEEAKQQQPQRGAGGGFGEEAGERAQLRKALDARADAK
jgi:hypothetical protein